MNKWKKFDTIKKYARGKISVDLVAGVQELSLVHAGNRSIQIRLETIVKDEVLSYPNLGKCWHKTVSLDGPAPPGRSKPVCLRTQISHDYLKCVLNTHHEIEVNSKYIRGEFRAPVEQNGFYGFEC